MEKERTLAIISLINDIIWQDKVKHAKVDEQTLYSFVTSCVL